MMARWLFIALLTLLMAALVIGCAKQETPSETPVAPPADTGSTTAPPADTGSTETAPADTGATPEGTTEGAAGTGEEKTFTYTCEMHPEVAENKPGKCPQCQMFLKAKVDEGVKVEYYCPMHPDVVQDEPGECAQCGGMPLPARIVQEGGEKGQEPSAPEEGGKGTS
jgi:hypothetical protein